MTTAGIYLHFPFCKTKCMYCDFFSITKREHQIPQFTDALIHEIEIFVNTHHIDWTFDTIFLGGGTPSLIDTKNLERIIETLHKYFNLSEIKEFTLEANPGEAPLEKLKEFRQLGINRLSMGFQSFNDKLLEFLGRLHTARDCFTTFENARTAGFNNINADLIFDIPHQTMNQWEDDLKSLVNLDPEHISTYSLTVEENTTLFGLVNSGKVQMPSEVLDMEMFIHTRRYLEENGYSPYEISNFSKTNMECMHNLHYWNVENYLAFGPSAHGYDGQTRWWNVKSLEQYFKEIKLNKLPILSSETLSPSDHYNELIFNGLRLTQGIKLHILQNAYPYDFESYIDFKLKKWSGLIEDDGYLKLNNEGILLADEIASDLFVD